MPLISTRKRPPTPTSWTRHLVAIMAVLLVAGCGGGGCSSCSCGGVTPLADGFNPKQRIENSGSVRITDAGLTFLEQNLGTLATGLLASGANGGVLTFDVPKTNVGNIPGFTITACPQGPDPNSNPPSCRAEINVGAAQFKLNPASPHDLHIVGPLPLRLRALPILIDGPIPTMIDSFITTAVIDGDGTCPGGAQKYANIDINVDINIAADQNPSSSRYGYSKISVNLGFKDQNQIKDAFTFCPSNVGNNILELVVDAAFNLIFDPLKKTLKSQIDQQLCQKANPDINPTCPKGTNDVNGICREGTKDSDPCASIVLGTDGHINLGSLLSSISPGTTGGLDFLFAAGGLGKSDHHPNYAWGDLDPGKITGGVGDGFTLGMYGGAEPSPVSKCVKMSDLTLPTGIPIPAELFGNSVSDWPAGTPGPHLGLAISERFANYAMKGIYNSGLLCLGISTENVALLNSGTIGLLAASSKTLGLQGDSQQVAIVIRPSSPPTVTFGNGTNLTTDPLLRVKLNQASFDFYIFSLDRFIRFMTATFDLDVPVNLTVTPDGLTPVLNKIGVNNGKVTNSALLREKPETIAASLGDLLASQVGQLAGGGLKPIDLNASLSSLGLSLIIPDTVDGKGSPGLRKLSKDSDNYLGIFASFGLPSAMPKILPPTSKTTAQLVDKKVDHEGLVLATIREDNAPIASLYVGSSLDDGSHAVEYQYRVDQGFWHPYTRSRRIDVQDGWLRAQGKHVIAVRSKVVGDPMTLDPEPAEIEVVVDAEPPVITVGKVEAGKVALTFKDKVSGDRSTARVRLDGGRWSAWQPSADLAVLDVSEANAIDVEAKDEEGNIASTSQELVRGRAEALAGGCGCSVAGAPESTSSGSVWLLGVAIAGIASRFWKRDRAGKPAASRPIAAALPRRTLARSSYVAPVAVLAFASTWAGCNCGVETTPSTSSGSTSSGTGGGSGLPGLEHGLIGAYTSVAVSGATVWVAGYSEADWDNGNSYGDLVVGKWNGKSVDWQSIDGVPTDPPPDPKTIDVNGFRGGQTESGDDVGLWTSIALDSTGNPAVAYYDRTNKALKLAKFDGSKWAISTVDGKAGTDTGRYAKIVALGGGFVIAYSTLGPGGDNGALLSTVRVATSKSQSPAAGDWTFEDAVSDKSTPCNATLCGSGTACVAATKLCATELDGAKCSPSCASGSACIDKAGKATCAAKVDASKVESYPEAVGDYVSISPDPKGTIGIAYYDRVHGNLGVASHASGSWVAKTIDGEDGAGKDTGDVGIGASLFIDASNDWHIAYVDGLAESLRYIKLTGGTKVGAPEVVDDGLGLNGTAFPDGQHLVGDDPSIVVAPSGEVRVSYQDATAGKLHYAVGSIAADKHTWKVQELAQDNFAGAFSRVVEVDGKITLVNWWRAGAPSIAGDVALVSPQ